MLILGIFFAGLLGYALISRPLDARSITPQIVLLVLGAAVGLLVRGTTEVRLDVELLKEAGEGALILCLFVDAARIDVAALRGTAGLPLRLLLVGLPLTIVAGAVAALGLLPGISPLEAVLVAVLVAPTDAALGAQVVTSPHVPLRIRQALNVESGLNDGLVTPLVLVAVAALAAEGGTGPSDWVASAASQIVFGTVAGLLVGVGGALVLRSVMRRHWMLAGADWMTGPAVAFLAWFAAGMLGGNVFIAAFVAGLATSATYGRVPRAVLEFGEVAGELLGLVVFFMFGLLLPSLGPWDPGVILFAFLALTVVRMLPVAVSLIRTDLAPVTVGFMGWFGPRGLASIVLSVVAVGDAVDGSLSFDSVVLSAVGVTVACSVVAHGLSAGPAVRAYERAIGRLATDSPELGGAVDLPVRSALSRMAARTTPAPEPGASD